MLSIFVFASLAGSGEPLRLHPANPHYFLFRGKPTVLITSGEHYGAVLNRAFDYRKYFETLAKDGLNHTRVFSGLYREVPGESFGIARNTLAPLEGDFVQPFHRVGPQKYDLSRWNDEYFRRWREFLTEAGSRGIIVEITLFTTYYNDKHWSMSPINAANNIQRVGSVKSDEVLTLKDPGLVEVQERFVRKLVTELNSFDNLYYEICNEPYFHGPTEEWQRRISGIIAQTESSLSQRHLISRNIANGAQKVTNPDPLISIFNFHYARPPLTVAMNWDLNRAIGMNETGFDGTMDAAYRIQAWDFLLAGGALYNNLDYSFAVGHEDGTFAYPGTQPGGGSVRLRRQLGLLTRFMSAIPFVDMKPDEALVKDQDTTNLSVRALSKNGVWAVYAHGGKVLEGHTPAYAVYSRRRTSVLSLNLPAGEYRLEWWLPREAVNRQPESFRHEGGVARIKTPEYAEDIALIVRAGQP